MKKLIPCLLAILLFAGLSSCDTGPVEITNVYLAIEDGDDFEEVKNFEPEDGPFYCIVELSHAIEGTNIEVVWTAVDIPSQEMEDEEIDNYKLRQKDETYIEFNLSAEGDWPDGEYNVEIFIDGESHENIDFDVK
jgi:hypothetical protein